MLMADRPDSGNNNKLVKRPDEALVRKAQALPAPPMQLADSLEDAAPRTFVHVDRRGQVRSPARYKALQAASYGAAAAIVGGVTVMYGALLGLPGVGVGAAFAAYFGWHLRRSRLLNKATVLLVHDQLDEAEALLRKVLSSWRCPRHVAALAEQNLGAVYNRRGNFEDKLCADSLVRGQHGQLQRKWRWQRPLYWFIGHFDTVHTRCWRSMMAPADERYDCHIIALSHRLNTAVSPIGHPATEP